MVVDLAIDGQGNAFVLVQDWLGASVNSNNGQTLVYEDRPVGRVVAAPVGPAVLDLLAHTQGGRTEGLHIRMMVAGEDATHGGRGTLFLLLLLFLAGYSDQHVKMQDGKMEGLCTHQWQTWMLALGSSGADRSSERS